MLGFPTLLCVAELQTAFWTAHLFLLCIYYLHHCWVRWAIILRQLSLRIFIDGFLVPNHSGDIAAVTHGERVGDSCIYFYLASQFLTDGSGGLGVLHVSLLLCGIVVRYSHITGERDSGCTGHSVQAARQCSGVIPGCEAPVSFLRFLGASRYQKRLTFPNGAKQSKTIC